MHIVRMILLVEVIWLSIAVNWSLAQTTRPTRSTRRPTKRTTLNSLPRVDDNPCVGKPDNTYEKHPLGCAYFFICRQGNVNTIKCPNGLAFNPARPPCDLASVVGCVLETPMTTSMAITTTPQELTTATISTTWTTERPTTAITTARTTMTTMIITTHEPTTTTTTLTTQNSPYIPPIMGATTDNIVTPSSSSSSSSNEEPITTSHMPSTTTMRSTIRTTAPHWPTYYFPPIMPTPPTAAPSSIPPPLTDVEANIVCPIDEDTTSIRFLSSNQNCSQYYICYHNQPLRMHCSDGLHWNHRTQKCDLRDRAFCYIPSVSAASPLPLCPRDSVVLFEHPIRCDQFLYCYHGHMTVQQCPFYYHWDVKQERCVLRSLSRCEEERMTSPSTSSTLSIATTNRPKAILMSFTDGFEGNRIDASEYDYAKRFY